MIKYYFLVADQDKAGQKKLTIDQAIPSPKMAGEKNRIFR